MERNVWKKHEKKVARNCEVYGMELMKEIGDRIGKELGGNSEENEK